MTSSLQVIRRLAARRGARRSRLTNTFLFFLSLSLVLGRLDAAEPASPPTPPTSSPLALPNVRLMRDVVYGQAGGHPLYLNLVLPKTEPDNLIAAIVYLHGGGWHGGTRDAGLGAAAIFAEHGYAGVSIEYRLAQEAPFAAQLEDCKCAVRFLRANAAEYHLDANRIGVMGESAGGHLSALMGLTGGMKKFEGSGGWADQSSRVQAVCDCFGPSDITAWCKATPSLAKDPFLSLFLGGTEAEHPEKASYASPLTYVGHSTNTPPFLIIHGDQDHIVPVQQSITLAEAMIAAGDDVTLHVIKGADHNRGKKPDWWKVTGAWPQVLEFFDHYLK